MRPTAWVLGILAGLIVIGAATADTLILKSGKKIEVRILFDTGKHIVFVRNGKRYAVKKTDLKKVIKSKKSGSDDTSGNVTPGKGYSRGWGKPFKAEKFNKVPIPFTLTATYPKDATKKFLEAFAKRVQAGSKFLWNTTEGQMYVAQITVSDKAKKGGDLRIMNLNSMKIGKPYAQAFPGSHMEVGGLMLAYTFTHELMHLKFNLPDEYNPKCLQCLMSANPRSVKLCTKANHVSRGESCWDRLKKICPRLVIPTKGKKRKLGKLPKTRIIVRDN